MVRVVAGHAVERARALGVAAAPGEGRALEPDPERIGARQATILVIAVALAADVGVRPSADASAGLTMAGSASFAATACR